jgi:hypothetical protein
VVNSLDVNFDLNTSIFKPYMEENGHPVYVDCKSNHPLWF